MSKALKMELIVSDISEEGEIASFLVTKEQFTSSLSKKADLTNGKLNETQLPDFVATSFAAVNNQIVAVERTSGESLQIAKDYAEAYTDDVISTKADLVLGKVPSSQLPKPADDKGVRDALSKVLSDARAEMIQRTDELQLSKADLGVDGKVVKEQLPNYDNIPGLETVVRDLYDNKVDAAEVFLKSETLDIAGVEATVERIAPTRTEVDNALMMSEVVQVHGFEQKYIDAGGYPFGTVLTLDDGITQVKSTVANNVNNPNSNVVGWTPYGVGKFITDISYGLNSEVILSNGDKVKSTVSNNAVNPNVDMTGWVKTNSAGQIFDASGKNQQEINDNQRALFVNILDHGAITFTGSPITAPNSYASISSAIDSVIEGGTLYIPSGKFKFNGAKKGIADKNINIICDGELYIDATLINFGFNFKNTPTTVSGNDLSVAPKKGDIALSFSTAPIISNPQNYFVHIRSTEPVLAVPLTGGVQYYYKLQNINILDNDFSLMFPSLYDYSDKNSITLDFYPMRTNTKVQLKLVLYNTNSGMDISSGVIRTQGYSNCDFDYSIKKLESGQYLHGIGFYSEYSNSLRFPNPDCSIFLRDPSNPTRGYNFLNSQSTLLFFSDTSHRKITQSGWYVARHGRYIYFDKVSFAIDDHFGHDYFLNNCPLPSGVSFAGGSLTLKDCSNLAGYLVNLRADSPFAEGTLLIENCKPARGYLYTPRGDLPTYEGFTNPAKTWDEIIINAASSAKVTSQDCNMQINNILDGYTFEQTKLLKIDSNFEVENAYSGAFAAIIDGKYAPIRSHFKKIILNNVNYSISGTQTVTGGNMPLRNIAADTIELNNCFGLVLAGCRADTVFINGGSYGVPANAIVQTWLTDIKQLNAASVNIFIDNTVMSSNARLYTLTADSPSVSKAYYISDSVLNISLILSYTEASYVQKLTNNCGYSGQGAWLSFDIKNYYKDDARGERYAKVSTTVPSLAVGASSTVFTAAFNNGRVNMFESVVGSFNVNSKGLRIVAWVSATDTISYYIENPTGNPNGAVTLGAVNILFKTV